MDLQQYWTQAQQGLIEFGPKLAAAVAILIAAFIIAKLLAYAVRYLVNWSGFGGEDLASALGRAVFWVTILIALPAILGSLGMQGLLAPMQEMSSKFLNFLPNLIGAGLIFGIGFMVAKVAREAVTSVLRAAQFDALADRIGLSALTADGANAPDRSVKTATSKRSSAALDVDISSILETEASGLSGLLGTLVYASDNPRGDCRLGHAWY